MSLYRVAPVALMRQATHRPKGQKGQTMKNGDRVTIKPSFRGKSESEQVYTVSGIEEGIPRADITPEVWTAGPIAPVEVVGFHMIQLAPSTPTPTPAPAEPRADYLQRLKDAGLAPTKREPLAFTVVSVHPKTLARFVDHVERLSAFEAGKYISAQGLEVIAVFDGRLADRWAMVSA